MRERVDMVRIRIADITISLSSEDPNLDLLAEGALRKFLVDDGADPDVRIRASWGERREEPEGEEIFNSGGLWKLSIQKDGTYRIRFVSSALGDLPYKEAVFTSDFTSGDVRLYRHALSEGPSVYPLEYPLDELLILNLLARGRGAEVHACGAVDSSGCGHLFVGPSGAGKTTLARMLRKEPGVAILSDDRIILRERDGGIWMYGTPWHGEAELSSPSGVPLARIYFLRHGKENFLSRKMRADAVARLFASSFPPFYDSRGLDFTLGFYEEVTQAVPCFELGFVPDPSVIGFLARD